MNGGHPVRLVVTDDLRRSRLTVFSRLLLAIPHFIWLALFGIVALVVVFVNWWATLFRGRSPLLSQLLAPEEYFAPAYIEDYLRRWPAIGQPGGTNPFAHAVPDRVAH